MFLLNSCRHLALAFVLIDLSMSAIRLSAQMSEFETSRFVARQTSVAVSLNVPELLKHVDHNDAFIKKLIEGMQFDGATLDNCQRVLLMISSDRSEAEHEYDTPGGYLVQYDCDLDRDVFLKHYFSQSPFSNSSPAIVPVEYQGQTTYYAKYGEDDDFSSDIAIFFPAGNMVVAGSASMIRQMIDGESDESRGMILVNNLDSEVDFHLIVDDGAQLANDPMLSALYSGFMPNSGLIRNIKRLEIVADLDSDNGITATVQMNSAESAAQIEETLHALLQAAPATLEMMDASIAELASDENDKAIAVVWKKFVALGKESLDACAVTRDDKVVELKTQNVTGLRELPQLIGQVIGYQQIQMEKWMQEMDEFPEGIIEIDAIPAVEKADRKNDK